MCHRCGSVALFSEPASLWTVVRRALRRWLWRLWRRFGGLERDLDARTPGLNANGVRWIAPH